MKVLVCDDIKGRGERTRSAIAKRSGHETTLWVGKDLKKKIERLFSHAGSILSGDFSQPLSAFTDFDVVVLDNNLSALKIGGARHTAESIAGYVRAFGDIPYLVSLNKNPQVDFDLRYLVGDHQTQADLAVNEAHLSNQALWTGDPKDAPDRFLPWYWPVLDDAAERRRRQIQFVQERLDEPILESIGLSSASVCLSRHARGSLSPEAVRVSGVTFKKFFVTACRSLPIRKEREKLAKATSDETVRYVVSRVVAGELDRWFRRDILAPQDLLVDLPHLLVRMPFLIGPDAQNVDRWNDALTAKKSPYGLSKEIYEMHLQDSEFVHDIWTQAPCFRWRELKSNTELNQMFFEDDAQWAEAVFCEDISRFVLREGSKLPPAEFAAEFEGAWNRRYVADLPSKHYAPKSRLAK